MNPVRGLARARGAGLEDLGGTTSNGMNGYPHIMSMPKHTKGFYSFLY